MFYFVLFAMLVFPSFVLAQVDPSTDPGAFFAALLQAVQGRNWIILVGLACVGVTFLARRYASRLVPWFATDRGGVALALVIALLAAVGIDAADGKFSITSFIDALSLAMTNTGGYVIIKKLFAPSDLVKPG